MAALKTQRNDGDVRAFLEAVEHPTRRSDGLALLDLMREVTGEEAEMWGDSIVGFGSYHYRYASGQEGDWPRTGFSPRKQATTLYIMSGFSRYDELLARLGKHRTGRSCLYVNKLADVDLDVLRQLVKASYAHMGKIHPEAGS